ncbi:osiris 10a [Arctopsyche grandis]|uniref:osiris 10a n=1 Tax=Arctopsyche grandis TaxID=121162 RepID=UPI00406D7408
MLEKLQDLEEKEEFNLSEGVTMKRDESGPRDISNFLDKDPTDFRSIVEGASTLMSRRAMQWDMSYLHPGLNLRIGPTLSSNGVLEFVMDPRIRDREIIDHEPSTVRLLTRQLLVPFLLGFKFQLSTLMPILFGLMVIVSKKALILAKIAVLASGIFGYNSLFGGNGGYGQGGGYYGGHGPGFSAYGNRYHGNDHYYKQGDIHSGAVEENLDPYYSASTNHGDSSYKSGPAQSPEDLRDRLERLFSEKHGRDRISGARNFAWNP